MLIFTCASQQQQQHQQHTVQFFSLHFVHLICTIVSFFVITQTDLLFANFLYCFFFLPSRKIHAHAFAALITAAAHWICMDLIIYVYVLAAAASSFPSHISALHVCENHNWLLYFDLFHTIWASELFTRFTHLKLNQLAKWWALIIFHKFCLASFFRFHCRWSPWAWIRTITERAMQQRITNGVFITNSQCSRLRTVTETHTHSPHSVANTWLTNTFAIDGIKSNRPHNIAATAEDGKATQTERWRKLKRKTVSSPF